MQNSSLPVSNSRSELSAIIFAMIFPTIFTWLYFIQLQSYPTYLQQTVYSLGKLGMVLFPAFWVLMIRQEKFSWGRSQPLILIIGLVFGLSTAVNTITSYYFIAKPYALFEGIDQIMQQKMITLGIDTPAKFLLLSLFYSLAHSLFEEYYWRWFVFDRLKKFLSTWKANLVSNLAFMSHHVVILSHFCGWGSVLSIVLSLAVAVGGIVWAWMFDRDRSFTSVWLSHALIDAGIFYVAYLMIYETA